MDRRDIVGCIFLCGGFFNPRADFQSAAGGRLEIGLRDAIPPHRTDRGVTLIEMVIVVAIAGIMALIALPSFSNGLDNLRLSQASDSVAAFLNGALNRSERRQQVVEVSISPRENVILLRSADDTFARTLAMPDGVRVEGEQRRILLLPGSVPPRFGIQLANRRGLRRVVNVDPITGVPKIERIEPAP